MLIIRGYHSHFITSKLNLQGGQNRKLKHSLGHPVFDDMLKWNKSTLNQNNHYPSSKSTEIKVEKVILKTVLIY